MALLCRNIGLINPFKHRLVYKDKAPEAYDAAKSKEELKKEAEKELKIPESLKLATDKIDKAFTDKKLDAKRHDEFVEAIKTLKELEKNKDKNPAKFKEALSKFEEVFADLELTSKDWNAIMLASGQVEQKISSGEKLKESLDGKRLMSREYFIDPTNNGPLSRYAMMSEGLTYKVDYKGDRQAELGIGLKDMTSNNVVEVRVTHKDKKTGETVILEGTRGTNGKFYTSEDKYVAIYTGDTVEVTGVKAGTPAGETTRSAEVPLTDYAVASGTAKLAAEQEAATGASPEVAHTEYAVARGAAILERDRAAKIIAPKEYTGADAATPDQKQIQYRREFIEEAQTRDIEYKTEKAAAKKDALESSKELDREDRIKVPEELKGMTKFNYADTLYNMDHGVQVMNALDSLSQVKGDAKTRTEIDMWEAIRKSTILSADTVGFAEVSRAVYGKGPEQVRERYEALKKETKSDEERTELRQLESFYIAANDLLVAIALLKPRKYEWSEAESEYKDENYKKAEQISAKIFDPKSEGPAIQVSLLRRIFTQDEKQILTTQTMLSEDAHYNKKAKTLIGMSEKAAYQQLRDASVVFEKGGEKIDFQQFETKLSKLREKGILAAASDPELTELIKANKSLLDKPIDVNNLTAVDIKLIRKGYMFEQGQKYVEVMIKERNAFIKTLPEPTQSTVKKIAESGEYKLSNEQVREAAANLQTKYLATVGGMWRKEKFNNEKTGVKREVDYAGAGIDVPFTLVKGLKASFGVEHNQLTTRVWSAHAGLSYSAEAADGSKVRASAGAEASLEGKPKGIIGAGIEVSTPLDEAFREYEAVLSINAGVGVSEEGTGRFGIGVMGGVERNIEGAVARIAHKLNESQKEEIKTSIAKLKQDIDTNPDMSSLTAQQKTEILAALVDMYVKDIENQAVVKLKPIQFLGAKIGVVFVPGSPIPVVPVFNLKVGFGVANTRIISARLERSHLDEDAERKIQDDIKESEGEDMVVDRVYLSGDLQRTADGIKTVGNAEVLATDITKVKLESVNREIHKHGLRLELVGDKVKIEIAKSDGAVDIFSDPGSGIETYTDGKDVFLNISTAQQLSFRRVDKYYPYNDFGDTHRTELYISDNVRVKNETIKGGSQSRLHYRKTLDNKVSKIEEVKNTVRGTDTVLTEKELVDTGRKVEFFQNPAELKEAREAMRAALRKGPETLSESRKFKLDEVARAVLKKYPKTYRQLSVDADYDEIAKQIAEAAGTRLNNSETTYAYQSMMMQSLALEPNKKGLEKHIKDWNQRVLRENLQRRMDDDSMAGTIADKVTSYYLKQLESGSRRTTAIERGTTVQVQVGTKKIEGYREAFYSPTGNNDLFEAVPLTVKELTSKGILTETEARAFVKVVTEQISPLPEKPEGLLRSPLGLYVLDGSEIIFGAKKTKQLAEVVNDPSKAYDPEFQAVYKEFETVVRRLRAEGEFKHNGLILRVKTDKQMALYDQCKNLTLTMSEKLMIIIPETQAASGEVKDYVQARLGAKFYGIGVAVAYGEETHKKTPNPPPDRTQQGGKEETGETRFGNIADAKPGDLIGQGGVENPDDYNF